MEKVPTDLPGVWILEPVVYRDQRGYFLETYSQREMQALGFKFKFVQDNQARSNKNVIRGIHYTAPPGQVKLVRCIQGKVWDVIVDVRPKSSTFKRWIGVMLTGDNFRQVLIPPGYAHGYSVLSETAIVTYKVNRFYDASLERQIWWNDPDIRVDWKIKHPVLSRRDQDARRLQECIEDLIELDFGG